MSEPRVESVSEGSVVVIPDPDGVLGALIAALLAEPGEMRLKAIAHGTVDTLSLGELELRCSTTRGGVAPTWSVNRGSATAIVTGDVVERLVDQAYQHRRAAELATFPIGGRLGQGRYVITHALRGGPDRGMYRARAAGEVTTYLATLGPPQTRDFSELRRELAFDVPGIAPLEYIGRLEPHSEAGHEGMLEREPAGLPAAELAHPMARDATLQLALGIARVIRGAHAAGIFLGTLRPELVYVQSAAVPVVTGIAPRAERFWLTATPRTYGVAPCFDDFYQSPEQLAQPHDPATAASDVFALGAMLAHWLAGEHPFEGEGSLQAMSIALGRRRAFAGPPELTAPIDGALAPASERVSLDAWIRELETLAR
ncbi:MAG TPA: hypothetical protein VF516_01860 [Kofleriaceae bacterium]